MILVEQLNKTFGTHKVIENISFSIAKGQIVGLIGPNGSGKTTLIRLMNGIISTNGGVIQINGFSPNENGDDVRSFCGTMTENAGLYEEMTGRANLIFFASLYPNVDQKRIEELIHLFHLEPFIDRKVGTYSTGMKKRLGLAKVLLHRPKILFLDEPTNGLDPDGIRLVLSYLKRLNQEENTTIVICSHVLEQLETVCDRYIFIEEGKKIEEGTKQQLEKKYLHEIQLKLTGDFPLSLLTDLQIPFTKEIDGIQVSLPDLETVSQVLKQITDRGKLYSAEILNNNLESLYFTIRRSNRHE
ncbi:ABC transporter ATP-binding protein [Alkalihalobacterium chitinilyticum]|uniref:ABC transporter ATP-binding protein n=1 Tax=Alkalihalobacterium chitinilyticum TaxID=2980103 RepID=A0ABT5VAW6_9BACI|nr:ABC transporter ATP-binding protein [Alkalihalobacterium chitinilyticum]MDE5412612.1 ABC transporter ATP-binding protein [Alkalihalobacterium chitinilyticum]